MRRDAKFTLIIRSGEFEQLPRDEIKERKAELRLDTGPSRRESVSSSSRAAHSRAHQRAARYKWKWFGGACHQVPGEALTSGRGNRRVVEVATRGGPARRGRRHAVGLTYLRNQVYVGRKSIVRQPIHHVHATPPFTHRPSWSFMSYSPIQNNSLQFIDGRDFFLNFVTFQVVVT